MQGNTVVHNRCMWIVHGENVVVFHGKMASQVVKWDSCIDIVRRVDINLTVEYMSRRISGKQMGNQRLGNCPLIQFLKVDVIGGFFWHSVVDKGKYVMKFVVVSGRLLSVPPSAY